MSINFNGEHNKLCLNILDTHHLQLKFKILRKSQVLFYKNILLEFDAFLACLNHN